MKEPIRNIELIKIAANAIVIWVVVMGFWPLDDAQQAVTLSMVMAIINVGGAFWQNNQTTPLAAPRDIDGAELSRAGDGPALKELAAIQTEAIEINKSVASETAAPTQPQPFVSRTGLK